MDIYRNSKTPFLSSFSVLFDLILMLFFFFFGFGSISGPENQLDVAEFTGGGTPQPWHAQSTENRYQQ
jgi:hypothetical protein